MKEPWLSLISHLINNDVLKQVCVDKVHLFVIFAIKCWHSFLKLQSLLFNKIKINHEAHHHPTSKPSNVPTCQFEAPVLFKSATFNSQLLYYLERIVGFTIPFPSMCWSDGSTFARCNITIDITTCLYKIKIIKSHLYHTLNDNIHKKAIIYCNTASAIEKLEMSLIIGLMKPTLK